tara:strand:- start:493 stop:729 length:237 start_codon:yes stop_codon:yes gene_type:complete
MKLRLAAIVAALFLTVGCATSTNLADGIRVDLSAQPDSVGFGLDISPLDAACTFSRAVNWDWAEGEVCPAPEEGADDA